MITSTGFAQGVLYIAFGKKYHHETRRSITSLRKVSPDVPIAVITDQEWQENPVPDLFIIRDNEESFMSKPVYMSESPFDKTLFLDTDTVIAKDITPIFGLLDWYDVGVRFDGPQLNEPNGLHFHTQCNSGVILLGKSQIVVEMFEIWLDEYNVAKSTMTGSSDIADSRGLGDQRYLSIAIAKSKVRPVHLASYLNFALFETIITYSPPVIYHGRLDEMEMLDAEISGKWDTANDWQARLWLSNIRGLLPRGIRHSDPILATAFLLRRLGNSIRRFFVRNSLQ